jgi:hypothetical protein
MRISIAVGLISLVGCSADRRPGEPGEPVEPLARLDLRAAMHSADVMPVGLTLGADGARFIFDQTAGLFRIDGDALVEVVGMGSIPDPGPTAPIMPPFTDLIAYAPNVFALTAIADGYLLDTEAMTLTQHFCYLPDDQSGTPVAITQRTDAIAFDAEENVIYAQPITRDVAGTFIRSQIAMYDARTGADTAWFFVGDDVAATAMITHDHDLILAQGSVLSRTAINGTQARVVDDLERFGVLSIDGMVIDKATNTLIVVDSFADAVFDIDLATITLE